MSTFPTLTAIGTSRVVDANDLPLPAVFICFAQATQGRADAVEAAVRARYPAADVLVGHVIDLRSIPRILRAVAEGVLNSEHKKALAGLPAGETAEDYIVILPDWDGGFVDAVGLEGVGEELGVAVFARQGRLIGVDQSGDVPAAALRLLGQAIA